MNIYIYKKVEQFLSITIVCKIKNKRKNDEAAHVYKLTINYYIVISLYEIDSKSTQDSIRRYFSSSL